jgi:cytidylate kinase
MSVVKRVYGPVVTVAALHGSDGTRVAERVADRLGVACLDRGMRGAVAERSGLTEAAVAGVDERPSTFRDRLVARVARAGVAGTSGDSPAQLDLLERELRAEIEDFLAAQSSRGGVVLGRGGAVVLAAIPGALHVHLGGPRSARVARVMDRDRVDQTTAEQLVDVHDRTRMRYVRDAYGVDGGDPTLYHLMVDATALDPDVCVELIVLASTARSQRTAFHGQHRQGPP